MGKNRHIKIKTKNQSGGKQISKKIKQLCDEKQGCCSMCNVCGMHDEDLGDEPYMKHGSGETHIIEDTFKFSRR